MHSAPPVPQLPALAEILPAETLAWKLELLGQGSAAVEPLLPRIQQRCFLLVGDQVGGGSGSVWLEVCGGRRRPRSRALAGGS